MLKFICSICVSLLFIQSTRAHQIFVSPDGEDLNEGTIESPLWSIRRAQEMANPGDTIYIRGGNYLIAEDDISVVEDGLFACVSFLDKSGTEELRRNYWAYPGEQPVFDLTAVKPPDQRVVAFWVSGDYIHLKGIEITGVQVTITSHTESYCVYSWGNHNIFELISMHDNKGTGLRHRRGGHNLFLNCDAYRNHDDISENKKGENTDGFGCHPTEGGEGNVFRGCRAWHNSDDGFDTIRSFENVTFENCWAGYNGYDEDFERLGDGNGFKIGGYASDEADRIPDSIPRNIVRFCVAFRNKANGFYANHHLGGNDWINNTAYMNSGNYNMASRQSRTISNLDQEGYDHLLVNNLGFQARSDETRNLDESSNTLLTNSFETGIVLTSDDFVNMDESQLLAPRKADGSLPDTDFLTVTPDSYLMDAGTDVGFEFSGTAPEIGAFEQTLPRTVLGLYETPLNYSLYPNPVKSRLYFDKKTISRVWLIDIKGKRQKLDFEINAIDVSSVDQGMYLINIITNDNQIITKKVLIQ